jgi:hypothetical protein
MRARLRGTRRRVYVFLGVLALAGMVEAGVVLAGVGNQRASSTSGANLPARGASVPSLTSGASLHTAGPSHTAGRLPVVRPGATRTRGGAAARPVHRTPAAADALVNNNAGATGTSQFTQSETTLLAFGNNVVSGFNDSGSFASGSHFTGWSRSTDGGTTWTDGGALPATAAGDAGDPQLARDNTTGRIYLATLQFNQTALNVFHSDDNAVTWSTPAVVGSGGDQDKEWLTVDNVAGSGQGNVYLATRDFGAGNGI